MDIARVVPLWRGSIFGSLLLIICLVGFPQVLFPQGETPIYSFSPEDYNAPAQNFSIVQSSTGKVLIGNNSGVLVYDGEDWRRIPLGERGGKTFALEKDLKGRILVGAREDFGYLNGTKEGKMQFVSLRKGLTKVGEFGDIKDIHVLANGDVLFRAPEHIFRWDGGAVHSWNIPVEVQNSFLINDKLLLVGQDEKLYRAYEDKGVVPLFDLKKEGLFSIRDIEPVSDSLIIAVTAYNGVKELVFSKGKVVLKDHPSVFPKELEEKSGFTDLETTGSGEWVIGTSGGGVILYHPGREYYQVFDASSGLPNEVVNDLYLDRTGNLWVALNNGVAMIGIRSPITRYGHEHGVNGTVETIASFNGEVLVGTLNGLARKEKDGFLFNKVRDVRVECWDILPIKNGAYLLAENDGIYHLEHEDKTRLFNCYPWTVVPILKGSMGYLVGLDNGLLSIDGDLIEGKTDTTHYPDIEGSIYNIRYNEDSTGFWLGSMDNGVYQFDPVSDETIHYDTLDGLPKGPVHIGNILGNTYFGTEEGLYRFDAEKKVFNPAKGFRDSLFSNDQKRLIHRIIPEKGRTWLVTYLLKDEEFDIGYVKSSENGLEWVNTPFKRTEGVIHDIHTTDDGISWMGGVEGLYRYEPDGGSFSAGDYGSYLSQVILDDDSTIFWGSWVDTLGNIVGEQPSHMEPTLSYKRNKIRFQFSAPIYFEPEEVKYSYKLEGFDQNWSGWKKEPQAVFTNLPEGSYTFRVRAKDLYDKISEEGRYRFTILPPWYRTTWAYLGYGISGTLLFLGVVKLSVLRVQRQKAKLERVVEERTAEIAKKNENLESANKEILEQKELIEEKNKDIFSSIKYAQRIQEAILPSHEQLTESIGENFVLFKPKDPVSGDFYWLQNLYEENGTLAKSLFAAVDCTGHGVPGAFVSIVGHNALNRAVNEFGISDPGLLLDKLNELVEETFEQQKGKDVKDGMDLALCCLDHNSGELHFAGANNPLYLARKEDKVSDPDEADVLENGYALFEIKADRQPIGSFEKKQPFTSHSIHLKEGDSVFIFSDGFADQFGGPKGKKFKYKPFKRLLLKIQELGMDTQRGELDKEFEEWKNGLDQVDDVCVLGWRYSPSS